MNPQVKSVNISILYSVLIWIHNS